jgi:PHP family Zn ribbon phosphoesterase
MAYASMMESIKSGEGFAGTIEFFPEEGKYHYDGHRLCGISLTPEETKKHDYLCPVCGKKVTVGVMHRVDVLADRKNGVKPGGARPFRSIIPLQEIISEALQVGVSSKAVASSYHNLLAALGNEFRIFLDAPLADVGEAGPPRIREAIARMRAGKVHIAPGFDGEYGKIRIFEKVERNKIKGQVPLF